MVLTPKALASLLARAYSAEFSEAQVMAETLLHTADDDIWNTLFDLMKDNEMHRIMIEEAVELLGFDVRSFKEYAIETIGVKKYDFSEEYITEILNEILKWET
jgi:Glu-tRNA(Gln) amidotransferase subunit E-like FAD-binding protein